MRTLINSLVIASAVLINVIGAGSAQAADNADARLKELNLALPEIPVSVGNYVGVVQVGNLLYVSGNTHGPVGPKGKLGREISIEQGYESSRQLALRELSIVRSYLGSLNRIKKVVKVLGMVNSADGFGDQPKVIDGFSDTMVAVFGDKIGTHARSTVGVAGVPGNNPVIIEMILEIE